MAGEPATERELLEGCRSGDPEAARALMRRHQPALSRVVLRLVRRRAVAEEIVQEAFLATFAQVHRIDPAIGCRAWLFKVAINQARKQRARLARADLVPEVEESAEVLFTPRGADPEMQLLERERRGEFERAMARLSPKLREIVLLHYFEDLPFREIAAIVGAPVSVLKVRAFRARAQLLSLLAEDSK